MTQIRASQAYWGAQPQDQNAQAQAQQAAYYQQYYAQQAQAYAAQVAQHQQVRWGSGCVYADAQHANINGWWSGRNGGLMVDWARTARVLYGSPAPLL